MLRDYFAASGEADNARRESLPGDCCEPQICVRMSGRGTTVEILSLHAN